MAFLHDLVSTYRPPFINAYGSGDQERATLLAMTVAEQAFARGDEQSTRAVLWREFFSVLDNRHFTAQYQSYDFEIVDYQLYAMFPDRQLLRGPRPNFARIARGEYLAFLGAAQFFGRFQARGPHTVVADAFDLDAINLSSGGAGPEYFFHDGILGVANNAKAVVLQVLSGRSVGCEEYPGMRLTYRTPDRSGGMVDRLELLGEIWRHDPQEAMRLVRKWRANYIKLAHELLDRICAPVILVWLSSREPGAWSAENLQSAPDFGEFPQLVDAEMVEEIASRCAGFVAVCSDPGLPHGLTSRFTGAKCPFLWNSSGNLGWRNEYYASAIAHNELTGKLIAALGNVLVR